MIYLTNAGADGIIVRTDILPAESFFAEFMLRTGEHTMSSAKRFVLAFICIALVLCSFAPSFALRESNVETSSLLVRICVYVEFFFPDGSYGGYATSSGTGILVGNGENKTCVITNASVCGGEFFDDYVQDIFEEYGFGSYVVGTPQVYLEGGGQITTVGTQIDEDADLALLDIDVPVYVPYTVRFRDADTLVQGEQVFSLCYAETHEDVYEIVETEGNVSGWEYRDFGYVDCYKIGHNARVPASARGGFLLDGDGAIIGTVSSGDGEEYAISSYAMMAYMDSRGYEYDVSGRPDGLVVDEDKLSVQDSSGGRSILREIFTSVPVFLWVLLGLGFVCFFFLAVALIIVLCVFGKKKKPASKSPAVEQKPEPAVFSGVYRMPSDHPANKK